VGWLRWLLRTSIGVDASTGKADYPAWPNWDLWDASVPDGTYGGWTNWDWWVSGRDPAEQGLTRYRPVTSTDAVPVQWFATLVEYCASPFRNPAGAAFVDCDRLRTYAFAANDREAPTAPSGARPRP